MYSTCLFCHATLGKNEAIEQFPVGRRLAFDAAKGRLWVVCRACERWNLTPLDERWEAIEQCERAFRDTKLRVSTENVGLARLREGTTLVRIGAPQRPELAAWRYGDQFGRRRKRYVAMTTLGAVAVGGVLLTNPFGFGLGAISTSMNLMLLNDWRDGKKITVKTNDGTRHSVTRLAARSATFRQHGAFGFEIELPRHSRYWTTPGESDRLTFRGDDALRVARQILPCVNSKGARVAAVRGAVDLIEGCSDVTELFRRLALGRKRPKPSRRTWWLGPWHIIERMPAAQRLALEMALHEDDERRALESELSVLEARWKEAEEIASISDEMFVPSGVTERMQELKDGRP